MISEIIKEFNYSNNNFIVEIINLFDLCANLFNKWNHIISNLSFEQLIAVAHLSSTISILIIVFTIVSILFGG